MSGVITFILLISCDKPILINESLGSWNNEDEAVLQSEARSCLIEERNVSTPCLKSFTKKATNDYSSTCGPAKRRS